MLMTRKQERMTEEKGRVKAGEIHVSERGEGSKTKERRVKKKEGKSNVERRAELAWLEMKEEIGNGNERETGREIGRGWFLER